jgi:hypothetical protein
MIPSIKGRNQPTLDSMFFPATHGEDVSINPEYNERTSYLDKPTIIMSNPNALIYQWMVAEHNAYWLDFFLRRDINVFLWN